MPLEQLESRLSRLQEQLAAHAADHPSEATVEPVVAELKRLRDVEPGTLDYEAGIQVAAREFRESKQALLGGPYRAWLVELANPTDETLRQWRVRVFAQCQQWLLSLGGATTAYLGELLFGAVIMLVSIFFFLIDGPGMSETIMRLLPMDRRYQRELVDEFDRISRAVVMATLLSAVAQGLLAGLGFWFIGVGAVFLLTLLAMVLALVPFIGAAAVWVPACFWLYLVQGRLAAAIVLAVYGVAIVSMADNVIKPMVLRGESNLHPLLALLSVLGGAQVLGPIGILVGPMVVVFLQTLLNILRRELLTLETTSS